LNRQETKLKTTKNSIKIKRDGAVKKKNKGNPTNSHAPKAIEGLRLRVGEEDDPDEKEKRGHREGSKKKLFFSEKPKNNLNQGVGEPSSKGAGVKSKKKKKPSCKIQ